MMPDETSPTSEEQGQITIPVSYTGMEDIPVYGCDHIQTLFMPTDGAILVQMFMTLPPRLNQDKDNEGRPMPSVICKCIGQFHLTQETARNLIDSLGVDLGEIKIAEEKS